MKTSLKIIALSALCAGTVLPFTGCAGTATRESTGEFVDDSAITAKIKTELVKDKTVKAGDVNVDTFKGIVQLSGFVDTAAAKTRAGEIAKATTGVTEVRNSITVK
jgi:hyperosmotically inducible protein